MARHYNTAQMDDDLTASAQQMTKEKLSNSNKKKDDQNDRLYRQSHKNNWLEMNPPYAMPAMYGHDATISDLERISLCMEYPRSVQMRSQFDTKPIKIQNGKNTMHHRFSSPTSPPSSSSPAYSIKMSQPRISPSIFANLQSMTKYRLEKIPEVPPPSSLSMASTASSETNENQNINNSVSSADEVQ